MKTALLLPCLLFLSASARVVNPIVDTDKSVNTYSILTIVKDLVDSAMTDEQKLDALFSFHRRMMHHYRLEQTAEDNISSFDLVKLYMVYGCSFCTQQAVIFRQLCGQVFGGSNVMVPGSEGTLRTSGRPGGHSSFQVRFNYLDKWHWVDPIIGAYARNRTDGSIASLEEIRNDPLILIDAEKEGRASMPYFMCTRGTDCIEKIASAYSYFDYDTAFMADFAENWNDSDTYWAQQSPFFTTRKTLMKGEVYQWCWDFFDGNYFNLQDKTYAHIDGFLTRDWAWYPPRHLCGWKDSLDVRNWPYFKPYQKVINGDTCYRYYANGIHTFEPDLMTVDPMDAPETRGNAAFYPVDGLLPAIRPARPDSLAEISYRIKLPYPLMSVNLSCDVVKDGADDSVSVLFAPIRFDRAMHWYPNYMDTMTADSFRLVKAFSAGGRLDTVMRALVDPLNQSMYKVYYGYIIKFVMKAGGSAQDAGINRLKVQCVFQHNMFALPQLEPGPNRVSLIAETQALSGENLKLALSWMDNGSRWTWETPVMAAPFYDTLVVDQPGMPRMVAMALGNTRKNNLIQQDIRAEKPPESFEDKRVLYGVPNPFNPETRIVIAGLSPGERRQASLSIYGIDGRLVGEFRKNLEREILWNAAGLASGVYFARLNARGKSGLVRLVLCR